jgi:hypothetical protein
MNVFLAQYYSILVPVLFMLCVFSATANTYILVGGGVL